MKRYLQDQIEKDLKKKMVFVGGPRQVGKTTLAKMIMPLKDSYYNWDIPSQREKILRREFPAGEDTLLFDEIHKYRSWRNYLKGLYDEKKDLYKILVTGSARLDLYRFGGDSLQGRYHYLRLHPFSLAEIHGNQKSLNDLLKYGGFPEPFLSQNEIEAKRWSLEYRQRLIREDLISLEQVQDLGNLELLMLRLPELVGSPLSINALREDLQVNHKTVSRWLNILEKLYTLFRLPPFGAPKIKAVKKEQKHYHYDWSLIPDQGLRFENLVASHLLKWTHYLYDTQGREIDLRYFRDVYHREVDFVVLENKKPVQFIECKLSDTEINPALKYLKERFPKTEAYQISLDGKKDFLSKENIHVCPAKDFLRKLI